MTIKTSFDLVITFDLERKHDTHLVDGSLANSDGDYEEWLDDTLDSSWCSHSDDESTIVSYLSEEECLLPLSKPESGAHRSGRRNRYRSETLCEETGRSTWQSRRNVRNPWRLDTDDDDDDSIALARGRGVRPARDGAGADHMLPDSLRLARTRVPVLEINWTRRDEVEADSINTIEADEHSSAVEGELDFVLVSTFPTPTVSKKSNKGFRC